MLSMRNDGFLRVMNGGQNRDYRPMMRHRREGGNLRRKIGKYTSDLPRRLYTFFISYSDVGAPSFAKFARAVGVTLQDIESFRKHAEFERADQECSEIRRDYLIDNGLVKRFDSSFTKFLLTSEYGMGDDKDADVDKELTVTLEVIGDEA